MQVDIIADSINKFENRITTFQLKYPRIIHSELMTHRMFSRNASSSRAIPTEKLLKLDPILPLNYFKNKPGMSGSELLSKSDIHECKSIIMDLWHSTTEAVCKLNNIGLHKQNKNRYLEPFQNIDVVVTSTDWKNFFDLRIDNQAQPEIYELAKEMKNSLALSTPKLIEYGYHSPYSDIQIQAIARCARVSYSNHNNEYSSLEEDIKLYNSLLENKHLSPFEHVARPITQYEYDIIQDIQKKCYASPILNNPMYISNFKGWVSYRRIIESKNFQ